MKFFRSVADRGLDSKNDVISFFGVKPYPANLKNIKVKIWTFCLEKYKAQIFYLKSSSKLIRIRSKSYLKFIFRFCKDLLKAKANELDKFLKLLGYRWL